MSNPKKDDSDTERSGSKERGSTRRRFLQSSALGGAAAVVGVGVGCTPEDTGGDIDAGDGAVGPSDGAILDGGDGAILDGGDGAILDGGEDADTSTPQPDVRAFPGAEGWGASSVGGRGGTVMFVTNLDDSGAGSFRAACEASGARIVVFRTSGTILLTSEIMIDEPFITIAGQTSPGGICIAGHTVTINTHDVTIRHVRFRVGSDQTMANGGSASPDELDCLKILGDTIPGGANDCHDVILDHCSFSWGIDENLSVSYHAHDITIQRCIVSEGLTDAGHEDGNHSKGLLVSGKFGGANNVSVHHNYFCNNYDRNPRAGGPDFGVTDIRNNVSYNYEKGGAIVVGDNVGANVIHNYCKHGPLTETSRNVIDINYWDGPPDENHRIYLEGNISPSRPLQTDPQWIIADGGGPNILTTDYQRATPYDTPRMTTDTASLSMADAVLTDVGATKPFRDSVDSRDVASFSSGSDETVADVAYPADYPTFDALPSPTDTNGDGIADSFETANGFAVGSLVPTGTAPSGYTWIEEYINSLA